MDMDYFLHNNQENPKETSQTSLEKGKREAPIKSTGKDEEKTEIKNTLQTDVFNPIKDEILKKNKEETQELKKNLESCKQEKTLEDTIQKMRERFSRELNDLDIVFEKTVEKLKVDNDTIQKMKEKTEEDGKKIKNLQNESLNNKKLCEIYENQQKELQKSLETAKADYMKQKETYDKQMIEKDNNQKYHDVLMAKISSLETTIIALEKSTKYLDQSHSKALKDLGESNSNECKSLKKHFDEYLKEIEDKKEKKANELEKDNNKKVDDLGKDYNKKVDDIEKNYKSQVKNLNDRIKELEEQHKTEKDSLRNSYVDLDNNYKEKIKNINDQHKTDIEKNDKDYQKSINDLKGSYDNLIKEDREKFSKEKEKINNSNKKFVEDLQNQHNKEIKEKSKIIEDLNGTLIGKNIEIKNVTNDLKETKLQLEKKNNELEETKDLLKEKENLILNVNQSMVTKINDFKTELEKRIIEFQGFLEKGKPIFNSTIIQTSKTSFIKDYNLLNDMKDIIQDLKSNNLNLNDIMKITNKLSNSKFRLKYTIYNADLSVKDLALKFQKELANTLKENDNTGLIELEKDEDADICLYFYKCGNRGIEDWKECKFKLFSFFRLFSIKRLFWIK